MENARGDATTPTESAISSGASGHHKSSNDSPSPFVIQITAVASLGGILFGYDLGVISGALPQLTAAFDLSNGQQERVVSILYVGGFLGALFGGAICDAFGRKRSILWTDVFFFVGGCLLLAAPTFTTVLVGRMVVGVAVSISGIADVSYLHEIAPSAWRGSVVSVNEACISLGFLLAYAAASVLTHYFPSNGWRALFGLSALLSVAQFVGMWDLPESPKWLRDCGRLEESQAALRRIYGSEPLPGEEHEGVEPYTGAHSETVEGLSAARLVKDNGTAMAVSSGPAVTNNSNGYEMFSPTSNSGGGDGLFRTTKDSSPIQDAGNGSWYTILLSYLQRAAPLQKTTYLLHQLANFAVSAFREYPRQAWIALFLAIAQQFCGQTNVLSFAPLIFAKLDDDEENDTSHDYVSGWTTVCIGLVKFVVTVLVIWKIEHVGRRVLLLSGLATLALGLLFLVVAFGGAHVVEDDGGNNNAGVQQGEEAEIYSEDIVVTRQGGFSLALPGVLLVVSGYSMSFGPLTWLLTSELFATDVRGRALGAVTIVSNLAAIGVTSTFLSWQDVLGTNVVFGMYLLITVFGFVFAFSAIPETKDRSVSEIDQELNHLLWWRVPYVEGGDALLQRAAGDDEGTFVTGRQQCETEQSQTTVELT